jgi:hypothetical protein
MPESKLQSKPSLDRAKAVIREQWSEVIQYMVDRTNQNQTGGESS